MSRKSVLKIKKGEEFKIAVKNIGDGGTIFYDQYKQAFKMLDDIVNTSLKEKAKEKDDKYKKRWNSEDYENNIIAFCGERGEGKSSAMCTFINSLSDNNELILEDIGMKESKIKDTYFDEPIIIDPSQFDDIHNILDIVVAKIYERFSKMYMDENNNSSEVQKEEVLNQFQKVYRQISMINNQTKILDNEFDYEGNIGKLSKLGESTKLKSTLKDLIDLYLKFAKQNRYGINKGAQQIIIAIDDLDLCSANAYKMAEQIRKYLILPQVIIVMAVKIEQLELCVQENNLIDFEKVFKAYVGNHSETNPTMYNEIFGMAERYVSKLIPKARRIYLPKVQSLEKTDIEYEDGEENKKIIWSSVDDEEKSLVEKVLNLITEKTDMIFLPEESGESYLLPDNLRDMVNWIARLVSMETPRNNNNNIYLENIERFYQMFEMDVLDKMSIDGTGNKLKTIGKMDSIHMHVNTKHLLDKICNQNEEVRFLGERPGELFEIVGKFEDARQRVFDLEKERKIYAIKTLYTITMNRKARQKKLFEFNGFVNGYIWGNKFQNIMPRIKETGLDRSRFDIATIDLYNTILNNYFKSVSSDNEQIELLNIVPLENDSTRISSVKNDSNKDEIILIWIIIGLVCNVKRVGKFFGNSFNIIFNNSVFVKELQVSVENYIVNICNVKNLYNKINMGKLGIEVAEFNEIAEFIEKENEEFIYCMKKIISNVDISLGIKEYCQQNNDYKEATDSRDREIIYVFFRNIYDYLEQKGIVIGQKKEEFTKLKISDKKTIDIAQLYTLLINNISDIEIGEQKRSNEEFNKLMTSFEEIINGRHYLYDGRQEQKFSSYLKNVTAKNVKLNLERMAGNIAYVKNNAIRYHLVDRRTINFLSNEIREFYYKVVKIYVNNPNEKLSEKMIEKYRELATQEKDILNKVKRNI